VVGDLVVAREGGVHRGPAAHHVGQDGEDDEVADDHAHRRPHQRIAAAAVAAWPHVATGGAGRCRQLEHDLPEEEHEGARDVEPVGQEGPVARVRALVGLDAADREDRLVGLAREQVAAAGAAAREQALAGRVARLDFGAGGR
jgi:hypothetical protein